MAKFDVSVKQIAREALPRLIDNLVFPNLVYKETISGTTAKQGDTVSVRCPATVSYTHLIFAIKAPIFQPFIAKIRFIQSILGSL